MSCDKLEKAKPEVVLAAHRLMSSTPIIEALPPQVAHALQQAMIERGASAEAAIGAMATINPAFADWLMSGGHVYEPSSEETEANQKTQLERVSREARSLLAALSDLSVAAEIRLSIHLQRERRGPWSHLDLLRWNPDPVEIDVPRGLLSAPIGSRRETTFLPAQTPRPS